MTNKKSKVIFIILFVTVFFGNNWLLAQSASNQLKAMKWIKRTVQADIKNIVKPTIFRTFTKKELAIAKHVDVNIVLDSRFSRVRAIKDDKKLKIEISTGFLSLIASLIDAYIIATQFNKLDQLDNYYAVITNYINTYQEQVSKGNKPSWPEPFHQNVGISDKKYDKVFRTQKYDYIFSLNMRIILSYILSHEYAHHIFEHLGSKKPKNLSESRRNEDEADDFAIRVNWMIGNNPLPVANYFVLFSLVEDGLHDGSHAPSACRLEKFLDAGIKYTEAETKNTGISMGNKFKNYLKKLKVLQKTLKKVCEEGDSLTSSTIPGLWN